MSLIDTRFQVDESKCVGCGLCQLACPSMLIEMNEHKKPSLKPVKSMDWYGCWGCQHCLTVCPNGAISVLGKSRKTVSRYQVMQFLKIWSVWSAAVVPAVTTKTKMWIRNF